MTVVRVLAFLFGLALLSILLLVVAACIITASAIRFADRITAGLQWPASVPGGVTC